MTRGPILLAAALAAVLTAGCAEPPEPEGADVVRLRERARAADLQWGAAGGVVPPKAFELLRARGPLEGRLGRLAMVRAGMDRESRVALLAPSGTRWSFPVRLGEDAVLRLGLGYAAPHEEERRVRYAIRLTAADRSRHLLLEEEVATAAADAWRDREIDLTPWAGQRVTLDLLTVAPAGERPVWGAFSSPEIVNRRAATPGWDVVLVVLDTLRADHLGSYGYPRPTSPALDGFAAAGIRFESAVSPAPWTRPAHRAMFTGLHPKSTAGLEPLPLAQVLRRAGYRTGAITGGGQVDYDFGFAAGFESYRVYDWVRDLAAVTGWFEATRHRSRFLFLHTYEIHDPYNHRGLAQGLPGGRLGHYFNQALWDTMRTQQGGLTEEEMRYVEALYDGGIAYTDGRFGELMERLEASGDLDRAIVIVTSDHGEQFFEHGSWRHGQNLYDHQLLVPLLVRLPAALADSLGVAGQGRVITDQVRLIDLYPTLLELLEIPLAREVQGRSLVPLLRGASLPPVEALAENVSLEWVERKALRSLDYKYVHTFPLDEKGDHLEPERVELYDLANDPAERINVAEAFPDLVARLEAKLQELIAGQAVGDRFDEMPDELDPELKKQLEALGYLGN